MGPITLFDKSFIQSLSVDESVWFDHFYHSNICPFFYIETLADLKKSTRESRTPEEEVNIIAKKFPEMQGHPNQEYTEACLGELLGYSVPMNGQIIVSGGSPVKVNGQTGMVVEKSSEAEAFLRWKNGEFHEVEKIYASKWRETLTNLDLKKASKILEKIGVEGEKCRNLTEAKELTDKVLNSTDNQSDHILLLLMFLNVPERYHRTIYERWKLSNYKQLKYFSPYAAYVYSVEIFFQISIASNLISSERASNRTDIGYLFYLPFCDVFISSDKLHRKCVPLFLRENQTYVWGIDLKDDLKSINSYYDLEIPKHDKDKGILYFSTKPPLDGNSITTNVWEKYGLNTTKGIGIDITDESINHDALVNHVKSFSDAKPHHKEEIDFDTTQTDNVIMKMKCSKKKGSWFQLPEGIKPE